ncbi:MAG: S24 family peptidase [Campylobacterales bacterium]|nr:S24 family peptidase [Campylobacterales bacterium]
MGTLEQKMIEKKEEEKSILEVPLYKSVNSFFRSRYQGDKTIHLDQAFLEPTTHQLMCIQAAGSSMEPKINAHDYIFFTNNFNVGVGELCVALVENEFWIRRLEFKDNSLWLLPENPIFSKVKVEKKQIIGRVVFIVPQPANGVHA